jgi:hypothetical protein
MAPEDIPHEQSQRQQRLEMTLFSRVTGQERREDLDALMQELRDVADALGRAERKLAAIETVEGIDGAAITVATTHVRLYCRPAGYAFAEADEPPPAVGDLIEADDGTFVVDGFRASPLPGDSRRCAVLVPTGVLRPDESEPDGSAEDITVGD